ncbi:hypothetical protein AGLY_016573 [Aphis glycines]|uniref:DUF659 domain-containing protein n=1 Tax=Aphis glycines TaxID=307491 RepID=A0A6G0SXF2_APHGL|nr:hypothetical protein AGLY_016573 [Aphis glycines]
MKNFIKHRLLDIQKRRLIYSVTGHFINNFWQLQSFNICTKEITHSHTSENLFETIQTVITEWKLDSKVQCISHDNAANITRAVKMMSLDGITSNPCAAHTLQLCIKKALDIQIFFILIKRASSIVSAFKHSYKRSYALENVLEQLGKPKLSLIQSCPTRWNSTMFMVERLLAIRQGIVTVMADRTHFTRHQSKKLEFIEENWDHCNILCNSLKPIHLATTVLCADQKVTISLIRPIIHSLIFKHLKINENENSLVTNFKTTVSQELSVRFEIGENSPEEVNIAQISCLLDPRYKNLNFEYSDNIKKNIKENVRSKILNLCTQSDIPNNVTPIQPTALDTLLGNDSEENIDEFTRYLLEPQINHNLDPNNWWLEYEK